MTIGQDIDIFAGFMKSITSQHCPDLVEAITDSQISHPIIPLHPISSTGQIYEKLMCDNAHPPLVFARSHSTFHPTDVTAYESSLTNGWEEYIDYHQQPGFIINENSQPQNRTLVFPFDLGRVLNVTTKVVFRIQYLKTYENAGWIEISVCSTGKFQLDTLHGHRNVRISVPHWHSLSFDRAFFQMHCKFQQNPPEVVVKYNPRANEMYNEVRKQRKVKIYTIEMCFQQTIANKDGYYTTGGKKRRRMLREN
jgi:hypothetical protein